jgi:[acyl-carrier-protein] S-malonyltransferase
MSVLLCPGQGAQFPGMGKDLAERWPEAKAIFDRADEALGSDLSRTMFEGTAEDVERTDVCQPAILTVTAAVWEVLHANGHAVTSGLTHALGLSLGEYTAHYAAGTLSFEDAVRLVGRRGRYMQDASDATPSGMAAVMGLGLDDIEAICAGVRDEGGVVVVANLNAPGQVVVSGENGALATAGERIQAAGAKRFIPLKVAGAFHSPCMQPAADRLAADLGEVQFGTPAVPVVSNVTAAPVTTAEEARETLAKQVVSPVLFERSLRWTLEQVGGDAGFVEPSPGRALAGFMKKIDRGVGVTNLNTAEDLEAFLAA